MTVPANIRKAGPYVGTGTVHTYGFDFKTLAVGHIAVVEADTIGTETTLQYGSDYTVLLNEDQDATPGGTITRIVETVPIPLPLNYRLTILSAVPFSQTTDLPPGGAFSAVVVENGLDNIEMQVQQLLEVTDRAVLVPPTSDSDGEQFVNDIFDAADSAAESARIATSAAAAASLTVTSLEALSIIPAGTPPTVYVTGYFTANDGGGGLFNWDPYRDKSYANGGTIIDPDTTGGWDGTASTIEAFLDAQGSGVGAGCWVKRGSAGVLRPEEFGAAGDNVTNDRKAIERTAKVLYENGGGKVVFSPGKTYYFNNVFPYSNIEWDFNYCNLRLRDDSTFYYNGLFTNPNGLPGVGNPLNPNADFRYDRHFVGNAYYSDEHRPLDVAVTEYPVGTTSVVMSGGAQGLKVDDWVFFCSGPHDGVNDWSGYQSFEMEYCKIKSISADVIAFYEPTVMTHRLLQPNAFVAGQSQYGAVAWWTLSKISDFSMEENLTFRNLRMVVDDTGWTSNKTLWSLQNVHNFVMENCHIHVPETITKGVSFYPAGRGLKYIDCRFTGKWRLCTGADMRNIRHRYIRCVWAFTGGEGYIHGGERTADISFDDCVIDYGCSPAVGVPSGAPFMFSQECESIKITNCKISNFSGMLGTPNGTAMLGHGSLLLENNELKGYWLQPPIRVATTVKNVVTVTGNVVDCTISSRATAGHSVVLRNGTFKNNRFNVINEIDGTVNAVGLGAFLGANSPHSVVFRDNVNIPDFMVETVAAHRFTAAPNQPVEYFIPGPYMLVLAHPDSANSGAFFSTSQRHTPEKLGIMVEVYGYVTVASTDAIRYRIAVSDVSAVASPSQSVTDVDLTDVPENVEFMVASFTVGAGINTGIFTDCLQGYIQRIAIDAADTFTGTLYITKVRLTTFPSQGS